MILFQPLAFTSSEQPIRNGLHDTTVLADDDNTVALPLDIYLRAATFQLRAPWRFGAIRVRALQSRLVFQPFSHATSIVAGASSRSNSADLWQARTVNNYGQLSEADTPSVPIDPHSLTPPGCRDKPPMEPRTLGELATRCSEHPARLWKLAGTLRGDPPPRRRSRLGAPPRRARHGPRAPPQTTSKAGPKPIESAWRPPGPRVNGR